MSLKHRVWAFHLAHMSKPAEDRPIYQEILKGQVTRILELGIGLGDRSVRLLEAAAHFHDAREIHYTGVDLFEGREPSLSAGLSIKQAYRKLARTGAQIRLAPGDAFSAVARIANSLRELDLVVISGDQPAEVLNRTWFYFPRMIDDQTQVFLQRPGKPSEPSPFDRISADEIAVWAGRTNRLRAA